MNAYIKSLEGLVVSEFSTLNEIKEARYKLDNIMEKREKMSDCDIRADILGINKATSKKNSISSPNINGSK
jgi:hypothetical protein